MSRLEDLIARSQAGDREASELLVTENAGLIWSIAKRFLGRGTEAEDLYQLGCLGFLKAVEGFDLCYGTQFSTYAVPKISGEIRRFLRDDGAIKVSRSLKEKAGAVRLMRSRLSNALDREPTVQELAEQTGISVEDIVLAEAATREVESIHRAVGEEGFTLENVLASSDTEEGMLEKIALRQAISELPDREKQVISLRYYHGLTQDRAAKVLGVSQVQISRIEKKAIGMLREKLGT